MFSSVVIAVQGEISAFVNFKSFSSCFSLRLSSHKYIYKMRVSLHAAMCVYHEIKKKKKAFKPLYHFNHKSR